MLESIIYSVNTIMPIFLLVVLGAVLGKFRFFGEGFLTVSDNLVFKVCLPCMLFVDIATANLSKAFDGKLILYSIIMVTAGFIVSSIIVPVFVKDNAKRGAFIQGTYRSNSAIIGVTMAFNMFGDSGTAAMATILPFVVALYNGFAVVTLSVYAPDEVKLSFKQLVLKIFKMVITNPLIISIALAILWALTGLSLPTAAEKSLNYLSGMAMPLALLSLGAGFKVASLKGRIGLAVCTSVIKTIIVPMVAVIGAVLLGFRGISLGVVFIVFGGPTAVSSYIMAKQMKSDHELAGQILLISTLMSVFTLFFGTFILKEFNLI